MLPRGHVLVRRTVGRLRCRIGRLTEKLIARGAGAVKILICSVRYLFMKDVLRCLKVRLRGGKCKVLVYSSYGSRGLRGRGLRFLLDEGISKVLMFTMKVRKGFLRTTGGTGIPIILISESFRSRRCSYIRISGQATVCHTAGGLVRGRRGGVTIVTSGVRCAKERHIGKCSSTVGRTKLRVPGRCYGLKERSFRRKCEKVGRLLRLRSHPANIVLKGCGAVLNKVVTLGRSKLSYPRSISLVKISGLPVARILHPGL